MGPVARTVPKHKPIATFTRFGSAKRGREKMPGMPMLCLAGTFPISGTEPDGDSVRFRPADSADWSKVPGAHKVHTNATGAAQLRADAIDALETHYTPTGGHTLHQPPGPAPPPGGGVAYRLRVTRGVRGGEKITTGGQDTRPGFSPSPR